MHSLGNGVKDYEMDSILTYYLIIIADILGSYFEKKFKVDIALITGCNITRGALRVVVD